MKKIIISIALALLACSCDPYGGFDFDENVTAPFLTVGEEVLFEYDASSCQLYFEPSERLFRAGTDTMEDYFQVRITEGTLGRGETLKVDLEYSTPRGSSSYCGLRMKEKKTVSGNIHYLWSEKKCILVAVKEMS